MSASLRTCHSQNEHGKQNVIVKFLVRPVTQAATLSILLSFLTKIRNSQLRLIFLPR